MSETTDNDYIEDESGAEYNDDVPQAHPIEVRRAMEAAQEANLLRALPSEFVANLIYLDGHPFSFEGRNYLKPVYNRRTPQILLKTARQVEKCLLLKEKVLLSNNMTKKAGQIKEGDFLSSYDLEKVKYSGGKVTWISEVRKKPCVKIKTRQGHEVSVATTHPMRCFDRWVGAGDLREKDRLAVVRRAGIFTNTTTKSDAEVASYAYLIGDGYCPSSKKFVFTQNRGPALTDFLENISKVDRCGRGYLDCRNRNTKVVHVHGDLFPELIGKNSYTQTVPDWVYDLSKEKTALFINRLWACDGHVKVVTPTKYEIVYSSMSKDLVRGVQALLWKFGIPTSFRENLPSVYKKRGELHKVCYHLRVETARGVNIFLSEIGALGKSENIPLLNEDNCNNNRDTLPPEFNDLIRKIYESHEIKDKRGTDEPSLLKYGLRKKPEYCLTYDKARKYLEFFDTHAGYDRDLVEVMRAHLDPDVYWDTVEAIEDIGEQDCVDFTVDEHHNFVAGGFVTHNSTLLCNKLVSRSLVVPYNKSLYVSPSHTQTRQFSNEKLRQAIEKSPKIKRYFQDSSVSTQVFEKGFTNGAYIFLRSAFRSADRARGISARDLTLDEIQDMYTSEIPVIMECTSHFPDYSTTMSGTPKTFDNTIEVYWQETTQNEWLVKCTHCNKWNYMDHKNIAPTYAYINKDLPPGPICRHCAKPIDPRTGQWVSFQKDKLIEGYHISQLMVPWICGLYDQWVKLLWKRDNYPFGQFMNEAMGLSYDSAQKPVTRGQLMACCDDLPMWDVHKDINNLRKEASRYILTAGIDWGEGNDGSGTTPTGKLRVASYTVLTIGAYIRADVYRVFYMKRYTGNEVEPDFIIADVLRVCGALGVRLIGADWGHGWGVNNELLRKFGPDRVIQFQYVPALKVPMKWDAIGRKYEVSRNFMMSELFYDIKHQHVQFFKWEEFQDFGKDILAIFAEYSEYLRQMKYDHRKSDPDDAFHSIHYARLAADIHLGKSRRYTMNPD